MVYGKFLALKPHKHTGPDNVPSHILKSFAQALAEPVTIIFNASLSSSVVLKIWKEPNIIPIPKVQQPSNEGATIPASLTSCLSKVLDDFVVSWLIDDVKGNQMCIKTLQKITKRAGPLSEHVTESRACSQQYQIRNSNHLSSYQ